MIINMSNGGSSGKVVTVNVTYGAKVGSEATVTCTNEKKTYIRTTDINGNAIFKLTYGPWTITAKKAYSSSSKSINVIDNCTVDISLFAATINITYPEGSSCTATNGTTTLTAPDTSGIWACVVPNTGTWTVQCSYDGYTDTKTVSITSNGQNVSVTFISRYAPKVTYTGDYKIENGNTVNWTIRFLTSGTLTFQSTPPAIDVFCVGGGAGGQRNEDSGYGPCRPGGGGGYTTTTKNVAVKKGESYQIVIGAGGAGRDYVKGGTYGNNGSATTAFGCTAKGGYAAYACAGASPGGNGGSGGGKAGGGGGSNGGNGVGSTSTDPYGNSLPANCRGKGQGTTTKAFGESNGELFAGGGAGSWNNEPSQPGGAGGGGDSWKAGKANTGGGGGCCASGGSGIVIIRAFKGA